MRMVRNVMMALAVLASATAANAGSFVWYTGTSGNAQSGGGPGAQGTALNLTCDTSGPAGSCVWNITMNLNTGTGGLVQHATDLVTAPGNGVSASGAALGAGQPFTGGDAAAGTGGSGASLLTGSHGSSFAAGGIAGNSNFTLLTFTLTRSFATGDLSAADIRVQTPVDQTWVWANNDGNYETVTFGSNPAFSAEPGNLISLPVIRIQNTPEPTSLGLLALGALAVVRRRVGR